MSCWNISCPKAFLVKRLGDEKHVSTALQKKYKQAPEKSKIWSTTTTTNKSAAKPSHYCFFCCCSLPIFISWITLWFTCRTVLFRCFTKNQGTPCLPWHREQEDKQVQVAFHESFHNNYEAIQEFIVQSKETEVRCMNKQGKRAAGKDKCVSFPFSRGDFLTHLHITTLITANNRSKSPPR